MSDGAFENRTVKINGERFNWVREHYPGFWGKAEAGTWEPQTYRELSRFVTPETIVIDIGANIGAITLYAARRAAHVICFEPDPRSHAMLLANIAANPDLDHKVTIIPKAVHSTGRPIRFGSQSSGGDSMSSSALPDLKTVWMVESVSPDQINAMLPEDDVPVFVKVDIECGEYDFVPAGKALWSRPNLTLLLSSHPHVLGRVKSGATIRRMTRKMFAALAGHKVSQVHAKGTSRSIWLSILLSWGIEPPHSTHDWLITRRD